MRSGLFRNLDVSRNETDQLVRFCRLSLNITHQRSDRTWDSGRNGLPGDLMFSPRFFGVMILCFSISGIFPGWALAHSGHQQGHQHRDASRAVAPVKRAARVPQSGQVISNSANLTPAKGNLIPRIVPLEVDGKFYQLWEQRNEKNVVVSQILFGSDRQEIMIDKDGDGFLEGWEIHFPNGHMIFRTPSYGRFMFMDVEVREPQGRMSLKYAWSLKNKQYNLYAMEAKPYKNLNYQQDFIVGCRLDDDERRLHGLASQFSGMMRGGAVSPADAARSLPISPECSQPPHAERYADLMRGIEMVVGSDTVFDQSRLPTTNGDRGEKGSFLQCLRHHNMDAHASRIAASFAQHQDALVAQSERFRWSIDCRVGPGVATYSFPSPGEIPRVTFLTSADGSTSSLDNYVMSQFGARGEEARRFYSQAYANVFFHEMLHFSLIEDEYVVSRIENCCGNAMLDRRETSCRQLADIVRNREIKQALERHDAAVVADYGDFRGAIRYGMGPAADYIYDDYMMSLAEEYNKLRDDPWCRDEGSPTRLTQRCLDRFIETRRQLTQLTFGPQSGSECRRLADRILGERDEGAEFCNNIYQTLWVAAQTIDPTKLDIERNCSVRADQRQSGRSSHLWLERLWAPGRFAGTLMNPTLASANSANQAIQNLLKGTRPQPTGGNLNFSPIPGATPQATVLGPVLSKDQREAAVREAAKQCETANSSPGPQPSPGLPPTPADGSNHTSPGSAVVSATPPANPGASNPSGALPQFGLQHTNPDFRTAAETSRQPTAATVGSPTRLEPHQGPSRPYYSTDSTRREKAIADHLLRSQGAMQKSTDIAKSVFNQIIPTANAETRLGKDRKESVVQQQAGRSAPRQVQDNTPVWQVPKNRIPNPLGNFGANSPAGPGLVGASASARSLGAGARSPASQPSSRPGAKSPESGSGKPKRGLASAGGAGKPAPGAEPPAAAGSGPKEGEAPAPLDPDTERALNAVFCFLSRPYEERVRPELVRPRVISTLIKHSIQVTDHEGKVHGSQNPTTSLAYDRQKDRLVLPGGRALACR
jgi:hypothetical protein